MAGMATASSAHSLREGLLSWNWHGVRTFHARRLGQSRPGFISPASQWQSALHASSARRSRLCLRILMNSRALESTSPGPPQGALALDSACKVALAQVAGKLVPVRQASARLRLSSAAGIVDHVGSRRAAVSTYWAQAEIDSTILIAGCDPAVAILPNWFAHRRSPVTAVTLRCSSSKALSMLASGQVHVAGVHPRDPNSSEYNFSNRRAMRLGRRPVVMVNFARWELVLASMPAIRRTSEALPIGPSPDQDCEPGDRLGCAIGGRRRVERARPAKPADQGLHARTAKAP
jgi:hypothetical protein